MRRALLLAAIAAAVTAGAARPAARSSAPRTVLALPTARLLRKLLAHGRVLRTALSGHRLLYYAGGALWLADSGTGRTSRLLATKPPVGLAIAGQRVVRELVVR